VFNHLFFFFYVYKLQRFMNLHFQLTKRTNELSRHANIGVIICIIELYTALFA
jgi:hypothetical protein